MTEPIQPALTAEQWREQDYAAGAWSVEGWAHTYPERLSIYILDGGPLFCDCDPNVGAEDAGHELTPQDRHATAALCLYGQPFGFTHEDVELIRAALSTWDGFEKLGNTPATSTLEYVGDRHGYFPNGKTLAARISALLPPREEP